MTLKDIRPGTTAYIKKLEPSPLKVRLMSMGLIKGTPVKVLKTAPFGDPIIIAVRSYQLSLRLEDAAKIQVRSQEGADAK